MNTGGVYIIHHYWETLCEYGLLVLSFWRLCWLACSVYDGCLAALIQYYILFFRMVVIVLVWAVRTVALTVGSCGSFGIGCCWIGSDDWK